MEQDNLESKVKAESNHPIIKLISSGITTLGLGMLSCYGIIEGLRQQQAYMIASGLVVGIAGYAVARRYGNSGK